MSEQQPASQPAETPAEQHARLRELGLQLERDDFERRYREVGDRLDGATKDES